MFTGVPGAAVVAIVGDVVLCGAVRACCVFRAQSFDAGGGRDCGDAGGGDAGAMLFLLFVIAVVFAVRVVVAVFFTTTSVATLFFVFVVVVVVVVVFIPIPPVYRLMLDLYFRHEQEAPRDSKRLGRRVAHLLQSRA